MDVFKTHVGEGKALMINEENFYLATRERKPYVVDSGGVKSFYAVCPECDNPIQLIGLLRSRTRPTGTVPRPTAPPARRSSRPA